MADHWQLADYLSTERSLPYNRLPRTYLNWSQPLSRWITVGGHAEAVRFQHNEWGDGSRLDVLRASGAEKAETILVCVDKPEAADRIVELVKSEFPTTRIMARAFDRGHSMRLIQAGVDYQIRETFESALKFGERALVELGLDEHEAAETIGDVRRRDEARLDLQLTGGLKAGRQLMRGNMPTPQPAPYIKPRREGRLLNEDEAGPAAPDTRREPADT